jgi:hypothetical protein
MISIVPSRSRWNQAVMGLVLSLAGHAASASAVPSTLPSCAAGAVCVTEEAFDASRFGEGVPFGVEYAVTNNKGDALWGFGVTNASPLNAIEYATYAAVENPSLQSKWVGTIVEKAAWDLGRYVFEFKTEVPNPVGGTSVVIDHTWHSGQIVSIGDIPDQSLGNWTDLFGSTTDTYAVFFWQEAIDGGAVLNDGDTQNGFIWFSVTPSSEFAAISQDGTIAAKGTAQVIGGDNGDPNDDPVGTVPEPGTLALFGLALAGAVASRKRKA